MGMTFQPWTLKVRPDVLKECRQWTRRSVGHRRDRGGGCGRTGVTPPLSFLSTFDSLLSSPFSICLSQTLHLTETPKMELFIPSMACMSAALGSNSQRDRLTAVAASGSSSASLPAVHRATARTHTLKCSGYQSRISVFNAA